MIPRLFSVLGLTYRGLFPPHSGAGIWKVALRDIFGTVSVKTAYVSQGVIYTFFCQMDFKNFTLGILNYQQTK